MHILLMKVHPFSIFRKVSLTFHCSSFLIFLPQFSMPDLSYTHDIMVFQVLLGFRKNSDDMEQRSMFELLEIR